MCQSGELGKAESGARNLGQQPERKVIHFSEFLHKDYNNKDNEFMHDHLSLFQAQVKAHALLQKCFPLSYDEWQQDEP